MGQIKIILISVLFLVFGIPTISAGQPENQRVLECFFIEAPRSGKFEGILPLQIGFSSILKRFWKGNLENLSAYLKF